MTAPEDRRKHPRYAHQLRLRGADREGRAEAEMMTENLSMGGLYCASDVGFPEKTRLEVEIELPPLDGDRGDPDLISLEAVVVRHEEQRDEAGNLCHKLALAFTCFAEGGDDSLAGFLAGL
jgi:hypothetical protein